MLDEVLGPTPNEDYPQDSEGSSRENGRVRVDPKKKEYKPIREQAVELGKLKAAEATKWMEDNLLPNFVKRYQRKKVHLSNIKHLENEIDEEREGIESVMSAELHEHQKEKKKAQKRKKRYEKQAEMRQDYVADLLEGKAEVKAAKWDEYRKLQDLQIEERKRNIANAKAARLKKEEEDAKVRRSWRSEHWSERAVEMKEEAISRKMNTMKAKADEEVEYFRKTQQEQENRILGRARMQTELTEPMESIGAGGKGTGIMIDAIDGKGHMVVEDFVDFEGNTRDGDDMIGEGNQAEDNFEHDVHLFSSDPIPDFEKQNLEVMKTREETSNMQRLYDVLQVDSKRINQGIFTMKEIKLSTERDIRQTKNEIVLGEADQLGPPRRLPFHQEIVAVNMQKERLRQLEIRQRELEHAIEVAEGRKTAVDKQSIHLAKDIAVRMEIDKKNEAALGEVNHGHGFLPMIVGQNISKEKGMEQIGKPREFLDAVTQRSKLVGLDVMSKDALKAHKNANSLEQNLWIARQEIVEVKRDTEVVMSRLAEISDRIKRSHVESMKANLTDSLKAFMQREVELNPVVIKYAGPIPWFAHHSTKLSNNVIAFTSDEYAGIKCFEPEDPFAVKEKILSNGVTLGPGNTGFCTGAFHFPKHAVWSVQLRIMRQGDGIDFAGDDTDFIVVNLGTTIASMNKIGTFHNKMSDNLGVVLHEISYILRGEILAFRFDFSSSSMEPDKHMAIAIGFYEERRIQPLEIIEDKNDSQGRERVISSFVKELRIDEKQGKLRETKLLEELILVEEGAEKTWDSALLFDTQQRYAREYLARILRAEILLEHKKTLINLEEAFEAETQEVEAINELEKKLKESQRKYYVRKHNAQQKLIDKNMLLVDKRLEVLDPRTQQWRHVKVLQCNVKWVDNNTKAAISHTLQEVSLKGLEIGSTFEADLALLRYFDYHGRDEEDVGDTAELKRLTEQVQEAEFQRDIEIRDLKGQVKLFAMNAKKDYRKYEVDMRRRFEETIDERARQALTEPDQLKMFKLYYDSAVVAANKGMLEMFEGQSPESAARTFAEQRVMADYRERRKYELGKHLQDKLKEMRGSIKDKDFEMKEEEKKVRREAGFELYHINNTIKDTRKRIRDRLGNLVSFDPVKFKEACPKPTACEHVRAKAWGDLYGSGVKCCACGKELSESYKEENQLLGYGSGISYEMYEAIERHRKNEFGFRFKDAQQLHDVEEWRIRLEKERREMQLQESQFYDYKNLSRIYKIDRRHKQDIKRAGVFRQGLQWNMEEIETYAQRRVSEEKQRIKDEGLLPYVIEQFDPFAELEDPPPTFREDDEMRRVAYKELISSMVRIQHFEMRIKALKEERITLQSDRMVCESLLQEHHKESYLITHELNHIEQDLMKTTALIKTLERMERIFSRAKLLLTKARRDKKLAEMNQVGVWDTVHETIDELSLLHNSTKEVLKTKFLMETRLAEHQTTLNFKKDIMMARKDAYAKALNEAASMLYRQPGQPVMTKYGYCWIRNHRIKDDTLLLTLPFGNPPGKLWMQAKEVEDGEHARQHAERLQMYAEDEATQIFYRKEQVNIKKERWLMHQNEQGLRLYYAQMDFGHGEDEYADQCIDKAVKKAYKVSDSKRYKAASDNRCAQNVTRFLDGVEEEMKGSLEQGGEKQKVPTAWERYTRWKEVAEEIREGYVARRGIAADRMAHEKYKEDRFNWLRDYCIDILQSDILTEMVRDIAVESIEEGKRHKYAVEKVSGIIFPHPHYMQYATYRLMTQVWKQRKVELQMKIDANKGLAAKVEASNEKPELTPKQIADLIYSRKKKKEEKERQARMNAEMAAEEEHARAFYEWELKTQLRERREMRVEDELSKELRVEEKKMEEVEASAYAVSAGVEEEAKKKVVVTSYDRRRRELKELTLERQRREEDRAFMIVEDKLSSLLREQYRHEQQRLELLKEIGMDIDDVLNLADFEPAKPATADSAQAAQEPEVPKSVKIPPWLHIPAQWDDWDIKKQIEFVKFESNMRLRYRKVEKMAEKEERKLDRLEARSYRDWSNYYAVYEQRELESELGVMMSEEETKEAEQGLIDLEENIRKIGIFCREKGEDELRLKAELRRRETFARMRDSELTDASDWLELCIRRLKDKEKLRKRILNDCTWVDSLTITGFYQRFRTESLRDRLYTAFFTRTVYWVVNRAEILANERKLMNLQENLTVNYENLTEREVSLRRLRRSLKRKDRMSMRRSLLNEKFFPLSRRALLMEKFSGWIRYFFWNRGHRDAFHMKYEVLKRQLDIERMFKQQLRQDQMEVEDKNTGGPNRVMQKHMERPVQCKDCNTFYLECANTSMSCHYHPGSYGMYCPRTCKNPGLSILCSSHKIRRWNCCDSTRLDEVGCRRRHHVPLPSDPVYDRLMTKITEIHREANADLNRKVDSARRHDWPGRLRQIKQGQVIHIEDAVAKEREKVARSVGRDVPTDITFEVEQYSRPTTGVGGPDSRPVTGSIRPFTGDRPTLPSIPV